MVVFATNQSLSRPLVDGNMIMSWKDGPKKQIPSTRRGRPRRTTSQPKRQGNDKRVAPAIIDGIETTNRAENQQSHERSNYEFVNCINAATNDDASTRKVIRSHVMLHRQHKRNLKALHSTPRDDDYLSTEESRMEKRRGKKALISLGEILGLDPFNSFPIKLEPYVLDLFSKCKAPANSD